MGRGAGRGVRKNFIFFLKIVLDTFQSLCYIPSQLKALRKRPAEFEMKFSGRPEGRYQRMELDPLMGALVSPVIFFYNRADLKFSSLTFPKDHSRKRVSAPSRKSPNQGDWMWVLLDADW